MSKVLKAKSSKVYRHTSQYYRVIKKISVSKKNSISPSISNCSFNKELTASTSSVDDIRGTQTAADHNKLDPENNSTWDSIESDDEGSNEILDDQIQLLDQLRIWALKYKITIAAVGELLTILRAHGRSELPKDGRTLLNTPSAVEISEMGAGKFWYRGMTESIKNVLGFTTAELPPNISLVFNIDGMSPFNSSNHQFWPISFRIDELQQVRPMVAAIYYGESKPPLSLYLKKIVEELKNITSNGLDINGHKISVKIKCFVCDTQARSFIKGTPACNAENGACIKCTVVGEWDAKGRHMSYPRIHCPRRTDQSFRNRSDDDHHKEETPLLELPIDMVEDVIVADSLHLFDLGVMRRCLHGWREGSYNFRTKLSRIQADLISEMLENCNQTRPNDIQRAIRSLKNLKFWKGSEYRVFLLYLGIIVLKDFLSKEVYEHFLMLSCAVSILSSKAYMKYINIAESLLENYIEKFIEIYGIDSISSNIHNLCHVIDDVKKFGPLPSISSYPFENSLGHLKSMVRHGYLPLSQISKRVIEMSKLNTVDMNNTEGIYVKKKLDQLHEHPKCKNVYNQLHLAKEFVLCADNKNQCFMTRTGDIVFMLNATYFKDEIHVYGKRLNTVYSFFLKPFASSKLNIFATKAKPQKSMVGMAVHYQFDMDSPRLYALNDIKCKLFRIQYHDEFVFLPLLHTLELLSN